MNLQDLNNKDLQQNIINRLGGADNFNNQILNFNVIKEFNFDIDDGDLDFCYGTFEMKGFFGKIRKYMFVIANGPYNETDLLESDFSFPAYEISDVSEENINSSIENLELAGNNIIPDFIKKREKIKEILQDHPLVSFEKYKFASFYAFKNGIDGEKIGLTYLGNFSVKLFIKELGDFKDLDPDTVIKHYS